MAKNIFATITHVAEKITEAITGHKNDEQAHPKLSEQIGVLSEKDVALEDQINVLSTSVFGDLPYKNDKSFMRSYPTKYFSSQTQEKDLNNIRYNLFCYTTASDGLVNLPPGQSGGSSVFECKQARYSNDLAHHAVQTWYNTVTSAKFERYYNQDKSQWTDWQSIATTTKTDISSSLKNGWLVYGGAYGTKVTVTKSGSIVSIDAFIKDGVKTTGTVLFTLPLEYRPEFIKYQNCNVYPIQSGQQAVVEINLNGDVTLTYIPPNATSLAMYVQYSV